MQFDFLRRLFVARKETPPPVEPPVVKKAAPPVQSPAKTEPRPKVDPLLNLARELLVHAGAPSLAARVIVRWNSRMRSTAGMAYPMRGLVTLNPRLREFGEGEVDRTLRHELAHLLAYERAGRRRIAPHGAEWQKACRDLGLADEKRTHDLPLPRRQVAKKYLYRCPSCALEVPRVKPFRHASACLRCCRQHNHGRYDARFRLVAVKQGK